MQLESTNIWDLRHVYSKKGITFICLFLFSIALSAQINRHNYNYLDFQKKPFYFGITLGLNTSTYKINHSNRFVDNNTTIRVAEGAPGPGFNLHVIGNLKIGEYFDFRFLPGFMFSERNIEYLNVESEEVNPLSRRKIESIFASAPFLIRYKSAPFKDKRAFVVAGLHYNYDVASNSQTRQADTLVKISPHDFQWEVGAGVQFFMPYFIFSPEIKYSQGLGNILIFNDQLNEASVLEKLISRVLTISFHIEG